MGIVYTHYLASGVSGFYVFYLYYQQDAAFYRKHKDGVAPKE
jgi:hypothetical protein